MKYSEHSLNILTAKEFKGIGDGWINQHLRNVLPYEKVVDLLNEKLVKEEQVSYEKFCQIRKEIEKSVARLDDTCDGVVAVGEQDFPDLRGDVKSADRPTVLFYRGDLNLLGKKTLNIAVIGLLNPDNHTCTDEEKIVDLLAKENTVIVSGLALGCDSVAHRQALKSSAATVAVLPSALNDIQPAVNRNLAEEIVSEGGLLVTEYYEKPRNRYELINRFVARDRLQAMFSDMVLLSASYASNSTGPNGEKTDSGSRHALEKAKDYGIDRAVIYHPENNKNPKYDLNREMMRDGTTLVIDPKNPEPSVTQILKLKQKLKIATSCHPEDQMELF